MASRKKNNDTERVAGMEPATSIPEELSATVIEAPETSIGELNEIPESEVIKKLPSSNTGTKRRKKAAAAKPVQEEQLVKKERRIMAIRSGVTLYSRPSLSSDAVIGTMPPNMSFEVKGTSSNPFGEFYKLRDGRFVSMGDAVKEI